MKRDIQSRILLIEFSLGFYVTRIIYVETHQNRKIKHTVKPVCEDHPGDQKTVAVMSRWPFYTRSFTHKMVHWNLEIVAFIKKRDVIYRRPL